MGILQLGFSPRERGLLVSDIGVGADTVTIGIERGIVSDTSCFAERARRRVFGQARLEGIVGIRHLLDRGVSSLV